MSKELENNVSTDNNSYKIIAVDNDSNIINSLSILLEKSGYNFTGITDPVEAIDKIKNEHFDLLVLDFSMTPFAKEIRKFDKELYILLLTDNKDSIPSLDTIKELDIQGFCEKSSNLEQLLLLIESGIKSISQTNEIKRVNKELEKTYLESIQTLRHTVDAKDKYTRGHSDRVSAYSVLIGKHLGLSEADLNTLRIGGLFHDVGKLGIPDNILLKEDKLSDVEYSKINEHPSLGANILSTSSIFKDIIPIVKYHHEKYDGTGYPEKLKGDDIPYLSRIATIADSFDAMASKRAYRNGLPLENVVSEFNRCKGTQFDPALTDVMLDIIQNHYDEIKEIQDKYK